MELYFYFQMIIKPQLEDGLLLYSGHHEYGDFILLCLNGGYVEFSFDLGSGPAVVRLVHCFFFYFTVN